MDNNKTVGENHRIETSTGTENGESTTALDNLTDGNGTYQPGMSPLANGENALPLDGGGAGVNDTNVSVNTSNTSNEKTDTEGSGESRENDYANMSAADLRKLCKERGLKSAANIKTDILIASLLEYDAKGGGTENGDGDNEQQEMVKIILKKGGSYAFRKQVYFKNKPVPVSPDIAQKLLRTGMFVKVSVPCEE